VSPEKQTKTVALTDQDRELIDHINQAIDVVGTDEDNWCALSEVGTALRRIDPSFDPRTYGARQLATLVRAKSDYFELKKVPGKSIILIRSKTQE